jgi:hypothetical protein
VREFFETWAEAAFRENLDYFCLPKGSPSCPARFLEPYAAPGDRAYYVLCLPEERQRFGMRMVPDPRIGIGGGVTNSLLMQLRPIKKCDYVYPKGIARPVVIEPNEAAIVFRLDLPIGPQIKTALR